MPVHLSHVICTTLGRAALADTLYEVRRTTPMKDLETEEEKFENIRGAFQVRSQEAVAGKTITLIDDLYRSGATLNELVLLLEQAGAVAQCLVATKTIRD